MVTLASARTMLKHWRISSKLLHGSSADSASSIRLSPSTSNQSFIWRKPTQVLNLLLYPRSSLSHTPFLVFVFLKMPFKNHSRIFPF